MCRLRFGEIGPVAELGTVERAYADGYAAAQAKIERLGNLCDTYAEFIAERGLWERDQLSR